MRNAGPGISRGTGGRKAEQVDIPRTEGTTLGRQVATASTNVEQCVYERACDLLSTNQGAIVSIMNSKHTGTSLVTL